MEISFFGVRGSTPCACDETRGVGGNTSCVLVRVGDEAPIILDLGTGLRYLGMEIMKELGDSPFTGTALVTHLHWDHVQGLPFFVPVLRPDSRLTVVGPEQENEQTLRSAFETFISPPLFPVDLEILPGTVDFIETSQDVMTIGSVEVTVAPIEHVGRTNGYRIQNGTGSVAYLSDHQQPIDGSLTVPASVVELCRDVDVLIHDAQYDAEEFTTKSHWGHSTVDFAVAVARESGAKRLVLFHHDPGHDDGWVAEATEHARSLAGPDLEVLAAVEGLTLHSGDDLPAD